MPFDGQICRWLDGWGGPAGELGWRYGIQKEFGSTALGTGRHRKSALFAVQTTKGGNMRKKKKKTLARRKNWKMFEGTSLSIYTE